MAQKGKFPQGCSVKSAVQYSATVKEVFDEQQKQANHQASMQNLFRLMSSEQQNIEKKRADLEPETFLKKQL
eukprot:9389290-Karenia_brevis.AAC.1